MKRRPASSKGAAQRPIRGEDIYSQPAPGSAKSAPAPLIRVPKVSASASASNSPANRKPQSYAQLQAQRQPHSSRPATARPASAASSAAAAAGSSGGGDPIVTTEQVLTTLAARAAACEEQHRFAELITIRVEVLALSRLCFGRDSLEVASAHVRLATSYMLAGLATQSAEHARVALGRATALDCVPVQIDCHNTIGVVHTHVREYPRAIAHLKKAHELSQLVYGKTAIQNVVFLTNLARAQSESGAYPSAIESWTSIWELKEPIFGDGHAELVVVHLEMGRAALALGDLVTARDQLQMVLTIAGKHTSLATGAVAAPPPTSATDMNGNAAAGTSSTGGSKDDPTFVTAVPNVGDDAKRLPPEPFAKLELQVADACILLARSYRPSPLAAAAAAARNGGDAKSDSKSADVDPARAAQHYLRAVSILSRLDLSPSTVAPGSAAANSGVGPFSRRVTRLHRELVTIAVEMDELDKAAYHLQCVLASQERESLSPAGGEPDRCTPACAKTLRRLGDVLRMSGRWDDARKAYVEAYEVTCKLYPSGGGSGGGGGSQSPGRPSSPVSGRAGGGGGSSEHPNAAVLRSRIQELNEKQRTSEQQHRRLLVQQLKSQQSANVSGSTAGAAGAAGGAVGGGISVGVRLPSSMLSATGGSGGGGSGPVRGSLVRSPATASPASTHTSSVNGSFARGSMSAVASAAPHKSDDSNDSTAAAAAASASASAAAPPVGTVSMDLPVVIHEEDTDREWGAALTNASASTATGAGGSVANRSGSPILGAAPAIRTEGRPGSGGTVRPASSGRSRPTSSSRTRTSTTAGASSVVSPKANSIPPAVSESPVPTADDTNDATTANGGISLAAQSDALSALIDQVVDDDEPIGAQPSEEQPDPVGRIRSGRNSARGHADVSRTATTTSLAAEPAAAAAEPEVSAEEAERIRKRAALRAQLEAEEFEVHNANG